jgi:hypothetical protein
MVREFLGSVLGIIKGNNGPHQIFLSQLLESLTEFRLENDDDRYNTYVNGIPDNPYNDIQLKNNGKQPENHDNHKTLYQSPGSRCFNPFYNMVNQECQNAYLNDIREVYLRN